MDSFFTFEDGNLLVRLLLAYIVSNFLLLTHSITLDKKTWAQVIHITITLIVFFIFSGFLWQITVFITLFHWIIKTVKNKLLIRNKNRERLLFIMEQIVHILIIILAWSFTRRVIFEIYECGVQLFSNYKISLIVLGYAIVIWPVGSLIKYTTDNLITINRSNVTGDESNTEEDIKNGGKLIGIFERIIIITFVYFEQYEAIGFLITGKSILRLNSKKQTEYVLAGTMASYAFAIIIGVFINWILKFH